MNGQALRRIISELPALKTKTELFPQQIALVEFSFFESLSDIYKAQIQEFYELMKQQKALRNNSKRPNIKVSLPSLYDVDKDQATFNYLRKLQPQFVALVCDYIIESSGNKKVKIFEILYGMRLMGLFERLFEKFLCRSEARFLEKSTPYSILLRKFFDSMMLEYDTIVFFANLVDKIISSVIAWVDFDKRLTDVVIRCEKSKDKNSQSSYVDSRHRKRLTSKLQRALRKHSTELIDLTYNMDMLGEYINNRQVQQALTMEVVVICEQQFKVMPDSLATPLSLLYHSLTGYYTPSESRILIIEYVFDYLFRKFVVIFAQTLQNVTCFYLHM